MSGIMQSMFFPSNVAPVSPLIYDGVITQGYYTDGGSPTFYQYYGFAPSSAFGVAIGSRVPTTLTDGKTLVSAYDEVYWDGFNAYYYGRISISGFSGDPLYTYLSYGIRGGVVTHYSSASTYSYNSGTGVALWTWSATDDSSVLWGFSTTGTTTFKIYN